MDWLLETERTAAFDVHSLQSRHSVSGHIASASRPIAGTLSTTKHLAGTLQAELFTALTTSGKHSSPVWSKRQQVLGFQRMRQRLAFSPPTLLHSFDLVDGVGFSTSSTALD